MFLPSFWPLLFFEFRVNMDLQTPFVVICHIFPYTQISPDERSKEVQSRTSVVTLNNTVEESVRWWGLTPPHPLKVGLWASLMAINDRDSPRPKIQKLVRLKIQNLFVFAQNAFMFFDRN